MPDINKLIGWAARTDYKQIKVLKCQAESIPKLNVNISK